MNVSEEIIRQGKLFECQTVWTLRVTEPSFREFLTFRV